MKGQRFINTYGNEITVGAKAVYLILTTLLGARTLGEEYVDLVYVNRSGKRFPRILPKLGFIFSYAILPYLINRLVKYYKPKQEEEDQNKSSKKQVILQYLSSYDKVLDTLMNLHIAIFYFQGEFYSLSKRIFGLRYVFGHNKDPRKLQKTGNYSFLGAIILLQFVFESLVKFKTYQDSLRKSDTSEEDEESKPSRIKSIKQLETYNESFTEDLKLSERVNFDLSDPNQLPYIPEASRSCMLCLSPMTNPSAANCGHMFCWVCIVDWIREHPECPLCRLQCLEQNLLPLR